MRATAERVEPFYGLHTGEHTTIYTSDFVPYTQGILYHYLNFMSMVYIINVFFGFCRRDMVLSPYAALLFLGGKSLETRGFRVSGDDR